MELTLDDFTPKDEAESKISETETTETKPEEAASETQTDEPKAEEQTTEEVKPEEAASEQEVYNPDFTYKVKDEVKEFPEWLKQSITSKELENQARDMFTKIDAFDGIKESRTKVEQEFNDYKNLVQEQVKPTIDKISQFEHSVRVGDFGKAFELADINAEKVVDFLLMDDKTSDMVFKKALEVVELQNNGSQAFDQRKQAHQESIQANTLKADNESLQNQLNQIQQENFNTMMDFTIAQNKDVISKYDSMKGEGAFRKLADDYGHMQWIKGNKLNPSQVVSGVIDMLGLSGGTPTQTNTVEDPTKTMQENAPTTTQKPATLPNITGGNNASVVGKTANTWDEYMKSMAS